MTHERKQRPVRSRNWPKAIFRDVQFWVPFVVLMIGLLLLRLVQ
ncbi:MAG: hypothetical protein ACR2IV_07820 [Bryobacteraceae bacterium]